MKFSLSQSMAPSFSPVPIFIVVNIVIFLANANAVSSIPTREFDSMLDTLRVRGYNLFCNAIVTSDVQLDLLLHQNKDNPSPFHSFTFFVPTDSSLFALDMTQTASSYTDTLRLHIVPRRLSLADLLRLPPNYLLPTLLAGRFLNLTRFPLSDSISVDGVHVAFPGLYYGRDVAVHGLGGILTLRTNSGVPSAAPTPVSPGRSSDKSSSFLRISPNSPDNSSVLDPNTHPAASPITQIFAINVTSHPVYPPPPVQMKRAVHAPASEPTAVDSHSPEPAISPVIHTSPPTSSPEVHTSSPEIHTSPPTSSPEIHGNFPIQKNQTVYAPAFGPTAVDSHSPEPEISPVIHGSSPASSPEIYLPAHTYVDKPVDSPGPAFPLCSDSPECYYSEISLPPTGYYDEIPAPVSPDMWVPEKVEVTLMKTFKGGDQGQIETVDFAVEAPEMTRTLMEVHEMRMKKSEPLESMDDCVNHDVGLGYQYMQCRRHDRHDE